MPGHRTPDQGPPAESKFLAVMKPRSFSKLGLTCSSFTVPALSTVVYLAVSLDQATQAAPITYLTPGSLYAQNFDTLPTTITSGTQLRLANTVVQELSGTVTGTQTGGTGSMAFSGTDGWYIHDTSGGTTNLQFTPLTGIVAGALATTGTPPLTTAIGSAYVFSTSTATSDLALGLIAGTNVAPGGIHRMGAMFTNNTGGTLNKFTITFDIEQYLKGASGVNTMAFDYAVGGSSLTTGTFVANTGLNLISPNTTASSGFYTDGNAVGSKTLGKTATVTGLTWASGTNLVIRWTDANESGQDDGLAIDNFTFSALPNAVVKNLVWNTHPSGTWNTGVSGNTVWSNGEPADFFTNDDNVTFSQAPSPTTITVAAGGVTAGTMAVSNSSNTYNFSGAGITATSMAKSNAGAVVFSNTGNNFGATTVSGGSATFDNATTFTTLAASGGSTVVLKAANTNAGGTTISGGATVETQITGATGAGSIALNGGTLKATSNDQTQSGGWSLDATNGGTIEVAAGKKLTLSGVLATTGTDSTTQTLTKTGDGILEVTNAGGFGAQYASRNLNVQAGTLRFNGGTNVLANQTILNISGGATVDESWDDGENMGGLTGAGTFIGRNGFTAGGGITLLATAAPTNFSGTITAGTNGVVNGTLNQAGADSRRVDLHVAAGVTASFTGNTSDFAGRVFVDGGTLNFSNVVNRGVTGTSALGLGNVATTPVTAGTDISLGSGANASNLNYTGTTANSTDRTITLAGTGALTIGVTDAAGKLTLTGVISSSATPASFTKTGPGTLVLGAATGNTYAGTTTTVGAGTLLANNTSGSATSGSNVQVNATGTFGGTGIISGSVTVDGKLSPGASIESLATGSVTFNNNSTLVYETSFTNADKADLLVITGNLTLNGTVTLDLAGADLANPSWGLATLAIASYTGTWNLGTFAGWADDTAQSFDGNSWTINYNDTIPGLNFTGEQAGTYVTLTQTAIPEPGTFALFGLGALALARRRR